MDKKNRALIRTAPNKLLFLPIRPDGGRSILHAHQYAEYDRNDRKEYGKYNGKLG